MYKHMIPIMAIEKKWQGKICLAFLFRVSLHGSISLTKHSKNKDVKGKSHCSFIRSARRIISLAVIPCCWFLSCRRPNDHDE